MNSLSRYSKVAISLLQLLALFAPFQGSGDEPDGIPLWQFNLVFGEPIVVVAELLEKDTQNWTLVLPSGGSEEFTKRTLLVREVLYAEHTLLRDARFSDQSFTGAEIELLIPNSATNLIAERAGVIVMSYNELIDSYIFDPNHQIPKGATLDGVIQRRNEARRKFGRNNIK